MHPRPGRQAREGISAHHAYVSRAGQRRTSKCPGRLHQVDFRGQARQCRQNQRQHGRARSSGKRPTQWKSGAMSMPTAIPQPVERENYLNKEYGVWSWLLTTDHKRIALLYLLSIDRKSTRLNSSHLGISYAVFCLKKKQKNDVRYHGPTT